MTDLATLKIVVDANGAIRAVDQFGNVAQSAAKKSDLLAQSAGRVAGVLTGALVTGLALTVKETSEAQRATAQLEAVLRSTGGVAGQTASALAEQNDALRQVIASSGEAVTEVQALLLTFTKIRDEVFPQATALAFDLAQALGTDVRGAALQLGKALNDPVAGLTALSRAGVQFSDDQKAVIKGLVDTNQLAKAQGIILAELETQVGGSAAAYRNTLGGALTALKEGFLDTFDASNWEGIDDLIDNINLLADLLVTIPTRLAIIAETANNVGERFDSFFAPLWEWIPGTTRGREQGQLDQSNRDLDALRNLLREQEQAAFESFAARQRRRAPGGLRGDSGGSGGGTAGSVAGGTADSELGAYLDWMIAVREEAARTAAINSGAWLAINNGTFAESIGEGERAVINFGDAIGQLPEQVSETQRVLTEQLQLSVARFGSDFLKDGFASLPDLWRNFTQLGRDAIGNIFAAEFMDRIGNTLASKISDSLNGAGLGVAGFGLGILSVLTESARRSAQLAEQMAASARSIAQFASRAGDAGLSDEQRALRDLLRERDSLARNAVASAGVRGFTGTFDDIRGNEQAFRILLGNRFNEFWQQIQALGDAYAANADAIRENIAALEEEARQRQAASLEAFKDSLALSGQSTLSPVQQLAEARRQYDAVLALARGGDASAIDSLPETARTLLDAARGVYASGVRYADEYNRVREDVDTVLAALGRTGSGSGSGGTITPPGDGTTDPFTGPLLELQAQTVAITDIGASTIGLLGQIVERLDTLDRTVRNSAVVPYGGGTFPVLA